MATPEGEVVMLRRDARPPPAPPGNGTPPAAETDRSEAVETILLPGEPLPEAGVEKPGAEDDPPSPESEAETHYQREAEKHYAEDVGMLRRQLLAGAAVVAVLIVVGGGLVMISGHPRQSTIAAAPPPVVAPSASLAKVVPVTPQPKSVTLPSYQPPPPNTEVAELEGIKNGATQQGQAPVSPPPVSPKPAASASPAAPKPPPPAHLEVTPENAVTAAQHLQAAPMATADQVQVLEVVTQMAALVRADKLEIANLQSDLHTNEAATQAKLADFERRLALAEAHNALTAAAAPVQAQPALAPAAVDPVPAALAAANQAVAQAAAPSPKPSPVAPPLRPQAPPAAVVPAQYRVQAASPGLAMLARVDQGGGDAAQIQVQVGDSLPGWGKVLAIGQQGTAWVVTTEHGPIE
jgi:hypothetical protein